MKDISLHAMQVLKYCVFLTLFYLAGCGSQKGNSEGLNKIDYGEISSIPSMIDEVRCAIVLWNKEIVYVQHFGHITCGGKYTTGVSLPIRITGNISGKEIEPIDYYGGFEKIVLKGYSRKPSKFGTGPVNSEQKGTILLYNKNGKIITVNEAFINNSCKRADLRNSLRVKVFKDGGSYESQIPTRDIKEIYFYQ